MIEIPEQHTGERSSLRSEQSSPERQDYIPVFYPSTRKRFLNWFLNWLERKHAGLETESLRRRNFVSRGGR